MNYPSKCVGKIEAGICWKELILYNIRAGEGSGKFVDFSPTSAYIQQQGGFCINILRDLLYSDSLLERGGNC